LRRRRCRALPAAGNDAELRTAARQLFGRREPDATGGAGDDHPPSAHDGPVLHRRHSTQAPAGFLQFGDDKYRRS
jgi:hypothetical protein